MNADEQFDADPFASMTGELLAPCRNWSRWRCHGVPPRPRAPATVARRATLRRRCGRLYQGAGNAASAEAERSRCYSAYAGGLLVRWRSDATTPRSLLRQSDMPLLIEREERIPATPAESRRGSATTGSNAPEHLADQSPAGAATARASSVHGSPSRHCGEREVRCAAAGSGALLASLGQRIALGRGQPSTLPALKKQGDPAIDDSLPDAAEAARLQARPRPEE